VQLPARPRALILDAGNTVIFLDEEAVSAELARRAQVHVSPRAIRDAQAPAKRRYEALLAEGGSHDEGWFIHMQALLEAAGIDPARSSELAHQLREAHDELNLWRRVPDGLLSALERAKREGLRLGVISNSEGKVAEILDHVGVAPLVEVIVDSGVEGISKPDPEIFRRALARMNVSAGDAIYVGDVPTVDVDGARSAGMGAVLIDPFDHYPDYDDAPKIRAVTDLLEVWI
jgi:putative hydrolase of the HAD superfamily